MTPDELELARHVGTIVPPQPGARCAEQKAIYVRDLHPDCALWLGDDELSHTAHMRSTREWTPDIYHGGTVGVLLAWLMAHYRVETEERREGTFVVRLFQRTFNPNVGLSYDGTTLGLALAVAIVCTQENR